MAIFLPIMLQKPSQKSKPKDHRRYLEKRLLFWKEGKLDELMSEAREIQKRILISPIKKESKINGFTRLMMVGKVRQANKLIDSDSGISGVHQMTDVIRQKLEEKHPVGRTADPEVLLPGEAPTVEEVIFENIHGSNVQDSAKNTSGSGGPTKIDADTWKHMLCSKVFGKVGVDLADEIAVLAKRLCTEDVDSEHTSSLHACRLVPLMKDDDGVRPIGIGETLKRIIGKCVSKTLRKDILIASGTLQTCSGLEAGIEAAVHAISDKFKEESCEAVILVDAENAFNRLNREVAIKNIKQTCPPLYCYLNNSYKAPAKLHLGDGTFIWSKEGATQGDNLAMPMYGISTRPLIDSLASSSNIQTEVNPDGMIQVWFADDSSGAGRIEDLHHWLSQLKLEGQAYGYFLNPGKTIVIVKDPSLLNKAHEFFDQEGFTITADGERHIGAVIGTNQFKEEYVKRKVEKWVEDICELAKIAKEEPQAALSSFNVGISQRWTYMQRTVGGVAKLFLPLEEVIREEFIPAVCGRNVSDLERRMIALPYRYGGLGIKDPSKTADREYQTSKKVTSCLTKLIRNQENDVLKLDEDKVKEDKQEMRHGKEEALKNEFEDVCKELPEKQKRLLIAAQEKGASSWLSSLPLKHLGYTLNKLEFRDSIRLRYDWAIPETPQFCACGKRNSLDHILICKKGGYVSMRHNALRDTEAELMRDVCRDVRIEPELIPIQSDLIQGNDAPNARLDISARGVWSPCERTFFDVRVTHPNADSHMEKPLDQIYRENESQKKNLYNERVIQCEKGTFTPLVFTTSGGMGPECDRLNKRLADLIALKTKEQYSHVVRHIRTRLRFALLKSVLVAVRGVRGKKSAVVQPPLEISFNLIPQASVD